MKHNPVIFVCLIMGDRYADEYVTRLYHMLQRHAGRPFQLVCYSDRPREFGTPIEVRNCSTWSLENAGGRHPTFRKLYFLDARTVPFEEYFYLDLILIIRQNMSELLDYALERPEGLVTVKEWGHPCYNSCVMRIRRGELQAVYDAFAAGEIYPQRLPGDQDFIYACVADKDLTERVALFPENQIVSYKRARTINRSDPAAARRLIDNATIVKFHGTPKPHQLIDPLYVIFKIFFDNLRRFRLHHVRDASFWLRELRQHWLTSS